MFATDRCEHLNGKDGVISHIKDGNLVICFDVEEVAPLYMGAAEFIIPREITFTGGFA